MQWQDYTASMLYLSVKAIVSINGGQYDAPSWVDIIYKEKNTDTRTAAQIKADIVAAMVGSENK